MKYITLFRVLALAVAFALFATILPATPALAAIITTVSPDSGKPGDSITIVGYGFSGVLVEVYFSRDKPVLGSSLSSGVNAYEYLAVTTPFTESGASGVIDVTFRVPTQLSLGNAAERVRNGTYYISVTSLIGQVRAYALFNVVGAGEITLSPIEGVVGTEVKVSGASFATDRSVTISFDNTGVTTSQTNSIGSFSDATFTIPESYQGSHNVTATDASNNSATAVFTTKPSIAVPTTPGVAGDTVTVSGTGFAANKGITISFDNTGVTTSQTNSIGSFSDATFIVPALGAGSYEVKATDTSGNSATAKFTLAAATVILNPTSGDVGSRITLSGTGFPAAQKIAITFDGLAIDDQAISQADGSLSTSFKAPIHAAGTYKVEAGYGNTKGSADFTILASFSLSQTTGYGGTEVIASGTGFQANQAIPILFENELVTTTTTDGNGSFTASFAVPTLSAGIHKVTISDGINTLQTDFSISAQAGIAPITNRDSPGNIGTMLTVSGNGFSGGRTVAIAYDGQQITTAIVNTDGTFSATFSVPASRGGEHSIIATDGTTPWLFTFFMETTPPPIPQPLKPEMGIKAEARAYFDWADVTDANGVTYTLQIATDNNFSQTSLVLEKTGLTSSEYTITKNESLPSASKDSPYYWRIKATDGASNESQWAGTGAFYVGSGFALSPTTIYIILGVGAALLGVFGFWLGRKTAYY